MKNKYKWLVLVVMAVTFLLCTQSGVWAEEKYKVMYVKSEAGLNLREEPSTNSKIIAKLPKGQSMIVGDRYGSWLKVLTEARGKVQLGWVHAAFVTDIDPTEQNVYSYKELLSDDPMQAAAIFICYNTILDAEFLQSTAPSTAEEFSSQLLSLEYEVDDVDGRDDWKLPSRTIKEGGDCEDLTTFVLAKALSCFDEVGFIMMTPEYAASNSINSTHIAAVIKFDDGELVVIDLACSTKYKFLDIDEYLGRVGRNTKLTRYRIWWLMTLNSSQEGIKRIPK